MTNRIGSKAIPMRACANLSIFNAHLSFITGQGLTPVLSCSPMMTDRKYVGFPDNVIQQHIHKKEDGAFEAMVVNIGEEYCNLMYVVPETAMLYLRLLYPERVCDVQIPLESIIEIRSAESPVISLRRYGWELNTIDIGLVVVTHDGVKYEPEVFKGTDVLKFNAPQSIGASVADMEVYKGIAERYFDTSKGKNQTLDDADLSNVVQGAFGKKPD